MLKHTMVLGVCAILCGLVAGCGYGVTAGEIADSYGTLNSSGLRPKTVDLIQSGQADKMIKDGIASVQNRVISTANGRMLVTEYLIEGSIYRVELRPAVDPTDNVGRRRLRYGHIRDEHEMTSISGLELQCLWSALKNHSYAGEAQVAYRAWKGRDGKVRPVLVDKNTTVSDWNHHEKGVDVSIRTKNYPITTMWFRGLVTDGRAKAAWSTPHPTKTWDRATLNAMDGRWVMYSPGPGVKIPPFVNSELCDKIRCLQNHNENQPNE
ncbi:MAG: hypothetical protein HN909_07325 [Phycisphaerales bacterium]|jgi:hypothetical protein|nr:hypothetical protein [Phycisphaerales bacterium]MBT7171563.1 hypothetical protein [Phycisphaerales bacterium]